MLNSASTGFTPRVSTSGTASAIRPTRRSGGTGGQKISSAGGLREAPSDLLLLEDFNDQELLRALWSRYEKKDIYTWVGTVLVSVNPYLDVGAFKEEVAQRYASETLCKAPHLFATVRNALAAPGEKKHAILITGESGAGKTEATRAILKFLARRHTASTHDHIRDRLLRSTPILEAFGNASTRQNTNSSRFGKFIEVYLSPQEEVLGATLQPYMLEASRVSGELAKGECTYHVFYLLRAALIALENKTAPQGPFWSRFTHAPEWSDIIRIGGPLLAKSMRLKNGPPEQKCLEEFEILVEGLLGSDMRHVEVAECFRLVCAVALLADPCLGDAGIVGGAALLRIQELELNTFLTKTVMTIGGGERVHRGRSDREVSTLRASMAQEIYAGLFGWLTQFVAKGISPPAQLDGSTQLGLLDLYGFEVFPTNGFEQFLINYCNERLQQFFNRQVFTYEAEEYKNEGLDSDGQWGRLMAACQLPAISLLEGQTGQVGIFGVINDRSRCAFEDSNNAGNGLADSLAQSCGGHAAFCKAGKDSSRLFGIKHFAGDVFYEAAQFVRKNASAHKPDIVCFLREQGAAFASEVLTGDIEAEQEAAAAAAAAGGRRRRLFGRTLISIFQQELNELCANLEARQCRHVRCLRPNDQQKALFFDDAAMLRQCRYSGLLEATRIRKQGFAHRRPLRTFAARYSILLNSREAKRKARRSHGEQASNACSAILKVAFENGSFAAEDAMIGHSKVFLRETAMSWLEGARTTVALASITALLRGHSGRQRFLRLRVACLKIQAFARGMAARNHAVELLKMLRIRRAEQALRLQAALIFQNTWRGKCARRKVAQLHKENEEKRRPAAPALVRSRRPSALEDVHQNMISPLLVTRVAVLSPVAVSARTLRTSGPISPTAVVIRSVSAGQGNVMQMSSDQSALNMPRVSIVLVSPKSLHMQCQQDCIRLLTQHQQLKTRLPTEHQGLLGELVQATDFLTSNSASSVHREKLLHIRDRVQCIKEILFACGGPSVPGPASELATTRFMQKYHSAAVPFNSYSGMLVADRKIDITRSMSAHSMVSQSPRFSVRTTTTTTVIPAVSSSGWRTARTPMRPVRSVVCFTPRSLAQSNVTHVVAKAVSPPTTMPAAGAVPVLSRTTSTSHWSYQPAPSPVTSVAKLSGTPASAVEVAVASLPTPARSARTVHDAPAKATLKTMSPSPLQMHRHVTATFKTAEHAVISSSRVTPVARTYSLRTSLPESISQAQGPTTAATPWLKSRDMREALSSPSPMGCRVSHI